MRLPRFALCLLLLSAPLFAHAEEVTTWNFTQGQSPAKFQISNTISVTPAADGWQIAAQADGWLLTSATDIPPVDDIRLTFASRTPTQMMLLWHDAKLPPGQLAQYAFLVPGRTENGTIELNAAALSGWSGEPDQIGFRLPVKDALTLQRIDFVRYSPVEKLSAAWASFWTFDHFYSYTINFNWGPLITFTPAGRSHLFAGQPPQAISANRYFYDVLMIAACILMIHWWITRKRGRPDGPFRRHHPHLFLFFCVFGALWILYDVRMGAEYIGYAVDDYRSYVAAPSGSKTLRDLYDFYEVQARATPVLKTVPRYGLYAVRGPFEGLMRYSTYPSLPARSAENDRASLPLYLVFQRPDISVNADGRLESLGTILSPKGMMIERYDDASFLFRSAP